MTLLDYYRSISSICSKKLKLSIYGKKSVTLQNEIYSFMRSHPAFGERPWIEGKTLSQFRLETHRRTKALFASKLMTYDRIFDDINNYIEFNTCVGMYDWSCLAKFVLSWQFVGLTAHVLGTDQHKQLRQDVESMRIFGSFAITELTHGSNLRGIQTTATYDPKRKSFLLNTPNLEAVKCWVGNLGSTATHSLVFAHLITQGVNYGVHMFLVPVRSTRTLLPLPGIFVGDLGSKLGLHGVDNGFLAMRNVSIPKENLMNRFSDVKEDGTFVSQFRDAEKRLSASLGALLMGRVAIVGISVANMRCALVIALRFSSQRRQFFSEQNDKTETPIIEYPTQLMRLVPNFAKFFVYERFSRVLFEHFHENLKANVKGELEEKDEVAGRHLHVLSCGAKAVVTSCAQTAIQTCRETCGGHGFLAHSNFGKLRQDNDPQLTYEGDNNVLIQQLVNYVLGTFKQTGVVKLFDFELSEKMEPFLKLVGNLESESDIQRAMRCLAFVMMKISTHHNNHSKLDLARAVVNAIAYQWYIKWLETLEKCPEQAFLATMGQLFAVQTLYENSSYLYDAGVLHERDLSKLQIRIECLCESMKKNLISAVDAVAPPDFVLNSSLGRSDGAVHDNIVQQILLNTGDLLSSSAAGRPDS
ncbi:peroxisomal acyl-coenzyme A oxidase 3-like [Convolutriloba macropyga]|uniref:peroxisomal acyl-coenzyme A oxidase 3-like n=1 Tax=Convolutriloba macropyga TaxID=536237 RepID=UPI003F526C50